jgi:hypothetical protein
MQTKNMKPTIDSGCEDPVVSRQHFKGTRAWCSRKAALPAGAARLRGTNSLLPFPITELK